MKRVIMVKLDRSRGGDLTYLKAVQGNSLVLTDNWQEAIDYDIDKLKRNNPSLSFFPKFIGEEIDNSLDTVRIVAIVGIVIIILAAFVAIVLKG